ncbi:MAG: hypothetical protein JWO72_2403 [Caulobacteraceae bacterium]|nr:hypothetical protein [Caulobacteraceae bacterium]
MFKIATTALIGLSMATCAFGGAFAQTSEPKPPPARMPLSPGQPSATNLQVSDRDMEAMLACKRMPNDVMMKDQTCRDMAKMHPDMMKSGLAKGAAAK